MVTPWSNDQTRQVTLWLERDTVRPGLERLVKKWNDEEMLLVDLADAIERLVTDFVRRTKMPPHFILNEVNWNELADYYARTFTNVTDDELDARLQRARDGQKQ